MNFDKVAIVGLGCIFPQSPDPESLWSVVANGINTSGEPPPGRWQISVEDAYSPVVPSPDKVCSRRACLIDKIPLDTAGLDLDGEIIAQLDPLFHLALYAGRQAWEDAQTDQIDRSRTGVIIGNIALPTETSSAMAREFLGWTFEEKLLGKPAKREHRTHPLNRYVTGLPGGVLAKALGLGGGSYTLDAACASSLYALKLAADELLAGRADAMLTGGISRPDCLYTQMGFSQLRALSPSGNCSPFDEKGDGLVVGEGAGIFVLKRLQDALDHQDHIYAVVTGAGLSNDLGANLLAPSTEGQLRAMRPAYQRAGWRPSEVQLIECHATGTPVGDAVEFESLRALWEGEDWRAGQCVIGGVKSNVGHALTAAGAAGLVKTLMAMKHRKLPPTANYSKSNSKLGIESSPFAVLQEPHDWETADDKPRRAAVSGFGFGGINAHLLLEEWDNGIKDAGFRIQDSDERSRVKRVQHSDTPIAIVGMDAFFGPWKTLHEFQERVLGAGKDIEPNSPDHWWGAEMSQWFQEEGFTECPFNGYFVEKIPFPLKRFRIPPKELLDMLPQQLLMLLVADRALSDSKWDESHRLETGLFVGLGLDLNTTNFNFRWSLVRRAREWSEQLGLELSESELEEWVDQLRRAAGPALSADGVMGNLGGIVASRIARAFKIGGPCFTISSEETSGTRALEAAVRALQQNELNYAIVGAVDLASDIRSMLGAHAGRRWSEAGQARPFDVQADGTIMGEGAAAVILRRLEDAERDGDRIYSVIKGMGSATGGGVESFVPTASACALAYSRAYENAGVPPESIGYLETNGSGLPDEDATEVASILAFFTQEVSNGNWAGDVPPTPPMVVGSSKADIGHSGAAAALASVVKASLCLHQSVLPPLRHATSSILQDSNTPTQQYTTPRHWLRDRMAGPRRAGVTSFSVDGNCTHLVLEEAERGITGTRNQESNIRYTELPETLFFCSGSDAGEILSSLDDLETLTTEKAIGLEALACHWAQSQPQNGLVRLALVAYSYTQLGKLLKYAKTHLKQTPDKPIRKAPSHPSDIDGRIFFSPEPLSRVGRVAFVYPGFGNHFSGMGRELSIHWPEIFRSQDAETESLRSQLMVDAFWSGRQKVDAESAIFGQVALGSVVTDLIRSYGIEPDAVIGYSLGESAALFGMRVWRQRHEGLKRMRESALFRTEMAGPHNAVRKAWELGDDEEVNWVVGVVNSPAIEVVSVLEQLQVRESRSLGPRAYLLIVNTPNECVIGGDADAVKKLVAELGCQYHGIPDVIATHCEVVQPVAQAYRNLHVFKTHVPEGVSFYSGVRAGAYEVTPESAADAILGPAVDGFDFTKVINAAYEDGVRVFLEIGPGASCSRMIRQILENREHVAISACSPSVEPVLGIKSVVAQAWAEGAPVKLGSLYQSSTPVKLEEEDCLEIRIGGEPFVLPPLPKHKSYIPAPRRASPPQPRKASGTPATERPSVANSGQAPAHPGGLTTVTPQSGGFVPPATPVSPTPRNGNSVSEFRSQPTGSIGDLVNSNAAVAQAHSAYLDFAQQGADAIAHAISHQLQLFEQAASTGQPLPSSTPTLPHSHTPTLQHSNTPTLPHSHTPPALDRKACMEFAIGKIGIALGQEFAEADKYPTRVRLPDEPLMLADRILEIEGEARSMTSGRVVTEHDIHPGSWYLDCNRIPTCIAVEAGQADLFLSGYLGIDFETKGEAVYRLLDAQVTFHDELPEAGNVIHYDIHIDRFFQHGQTWFFHFRFEGTVDGKPLLSMENGCAGFFTEAELAAGAGIIHTEFQKRTMPGKLPADWRPLVTMGVEAYSDDQVTSLRIGDLAGCFGPLFDGLPIRHPVTIPGGQMRLVDRVTNLDPQGGRFGIGQITAELDIHPDDWFLTCHFIDDMVMPGTLMYECCMHTLRIFLLRMGWIGEEGEVVYQPVPGVASTLKCRGQVIESTKKATYQVTLKEIGYNPEPFVIVDALMFSDEKPIVEIPNLTCRLTGLSREKVENVWRGRDSIIGNQKSAVAHAKIEHAASSIQYDRRPALYTFEQILAFAIGKPSEAFGDRYKVFDQERLIARLPGPPYQFLDRITDVEGEPWVLKSGAVAVAQYDIPPDAWYFESNAQQDMPFAVLLEIALQPCGWLAGYCGSALTSETDLSFRNLGGSATQSEALHPNMGTLTTRVKMTGVSQSGGMIIQNFDMETTCDGRTVYKGDTNFGFFSKEALANQIGIRDAKLYEPTAAETRRAETFAYPKSHPYPDEMLRMIDSVDLFVPDGGPAGLGYIQGSVEVRPDSWFFKAHFYQDPVIPGSLGLESFLQLLKVNALERWGWEEGRQIETIAIGEKHKWVYRGQVIPPDEKVIVQAVVTEVDDTQRLMRADGFLTVDGRVIYQMKDFTLRMR